jgi:hypothetical protein
MKAIRYLAVLVASITLAAVPAAAGPAQPHGNRCTINVYVPGLGTTVINYAPWWADVCWH